jgi:hypothetical protein
MPSLIILSIIIIGALISLFYLFNESKIETDSVTIAAVEARAGATGMRRARKAASPRLAEEPAVAVQEREERHEQVEPAFSAPSAVGYDYRELLEEESENYVIPQWMVNFFSSSDMCHTLDSSDKVVIIAKLTDPKSAEDSPVDVSVECDMSTQTVTMKLGFGEGAAAEYLKTKFYLFERGDLFELNRLVRQQDVRVDVLTRSADYTLEYIRTLRVHIPQHVLAQLKNVLSKIPS